MVSSGQVKGSCVQDGIGRMQETRLLSEGLQQVADLAGVVADLRKTPNNDA